MIRMTGNNLKYCIKDNWTEKVLILVQDKDVRNLSGYQVHMLEQHKVKYLLPVEIIQINQEWWWQYEIKNKIAWKDWVQQCPLRREEVKNFYQSLYKVLNKMEEYLLDMDTLLLSPAFIFKEENKYYFCSYPPAKRPLKEQMEELNDFIADVIDVKDRETVKYTYDMIQAYKKINI